MGWGKLPRLDLILIKQIIVSSARFFSWVKTRGDKREQLLKAKGEQLLKAFFFIPFLLNSFDLPSYGSESRKRYILRLLWICLEEVNVLKIALCRRRQMNYLVTWGKKRFAQGTVGQGETTQITDKMNFIQDSFQDCQDFPSTLRALLIDCFWKSLYIFHHSKTLSWMKFTKTISEKKISWQRVNFYRPIQS